jgi:hypothetical protein
MDDTSLLSDEGRAVTCYTLDLRFGLTCIFKWKVSLGDQHGEGKKGGSAMGWGAAQREGGMRDGVVRSAEWECTANLPIY